MLYIYNQEQIENMKNEHRRKKRRVYVIRKNTWRKEEMGVYVYINVAVITREKKTYYVELKDRGEQWYLKDSD